MSLTFKRYYWLWIVLLCVTVSLMMFGSKRIFSYNFGQAINSNVNITQAGNNIVNSIDTFDDSLVHDIVIHMSDSLYQQMLDTYTQTNEKDYFAVDVTIDGVTLQNVGVRLKGNSSLRGLGGAMGGRQGGQNRGAGFSGGQGGNWGSGRMMGFSGDQMIGSGVRQGFGSGAQNRGPMGGFTGGMGTSNTGYLPLMLKFDEFIEGQTYNGISELSLRVGGFNDTTLLAEMLAYRVYQDLELAAPDTAYTQVKVGNLDAQLYVLSELINEEYLDSHYPDDDGILYKSSDFYDFSYYGEDPTEYDEVFSQKTNKNKDDFSQLIQLIKFVDTSSDEEFETQLEDYIDVNSVLYLMAIDSIIQNNDGFNNARSNYYLYYNKQDKRFTILTWDQNLAFGGFGGGGMGGRGMMQQSGQNNEIGANQLGSGMQQGGMNQEGRFMGGVMDTMQRGMEGFGGGAIGGNGTNIFRKRLLASPIYSKQYEEIFNKVHQALYDEGTLDYNVQYLSTVFLERNKEHSGVSDQDYQQSLANLRTMIATRKSATAQSDVQSPREGEDDTVNSVR